MLELTDQSLDPADLVEQVNLVNSQICMLSEDLTYGWWFCFLAIIIILFISIFVVNYIVNNW